MPEQCAMCFHPAHVGRCQAVTATCGSGDHATEWCSCPGPSESAERPDGARHPLDEALGNIHAIALQLHRNGMTECGLVLAEAHEQIQNYLVRADDPPCPISAQELRGFAIDCESFNSYIAGRLYDLSDWLSSYLERKGS